MAQSKSKSKSAQKSYLEEYGYSTGPSTICVPAIFNRDVRLKDETVSEAKRRLERERILEEEYLQDKRHVCGQVLPVRYDD